MEKAKIDSMWHGMLSIPVLFIALELIGGFCLFCEWMLSYFISLVTFIDFFCLILFHLSTFFGLALSFYVNVCLASLGTMVWLCIWFGSSMKHFVTSRSMLMITFVIERLLPTWMIVFHMQHLKNSMRVYLIHLSLCCFISKYSVVVVCLIVSVWCAEVMQPALFVMRRWLQPRKSFVDIFFMCIASVHG